MKLEIISGGEFGVEQASLSSAFTTETLAHGYIRKGWMTSRGPCEKVKFLNVTELDTDKLRDIAQKCIDECDGVLIFRSGELSKIEENIKGLVGESKPVYEIDFQKPDDPRCVTTWALTQSIQKLYVTGRTDQEGLDIFFKKTFAFMTHVIKDLNGEFAHKELDNKRKGTAPKVKTKSPDEK